MNWVPFTPPSQGLNRKAVALDSQTGESFLIGVKAALEIGVRRKLANPWHFSNLFGRCYRDTPFAYIDTPPITT